MRRFAAAAALLLAVGALYLAARPPQASPAARARLAARFRFERIVLQPADDGSPFKSVRAVNPALRHIDGWISAVGAGAALADIEGTGTAADMCLVDPRNDSVTVAPVPVSVLGAGRRFAPFALRLQTTGYDPATVAPMGCLPGDFNEDGRTDLLVYFWGRTPLIYLRQGAGPLGPDAFRPHEIVAGRERWFTNAAVTADVDGDGHPDLLLGDYFPDGSRILDARAANRPTLQHSMSRAENGGRKHLLLWTGATRDRVGYRDASDAIPRAASSGWTLALGARDLTGDLRPEIYIANDFGPDRLLLNQSTPGHPRLRLVDGERSFVTPRSRTLGHDSFKGMGIDFGAVGDDGRPALAVSNIAAPYALLESNFLFLPTGREGDWARGHAPYRDESQRLGAWMGGWGWDMRFADLDNSGRPALIQATGFLHGARNRWPELQELAISNDELLTHPTAWPRFGAGDDLSGRDHDHIYVRDAAGRFQDIWPDLGLDDATVSRGVATADVCGDGRLSILIARQWSPSVFLRNRTPAPGRFIELDLRTPGAVAGDRPLIGAEARVRLADGRVASDAVDGGSGHSGKRAPFIHLGLGPPARGEAPGGARFEVQLAWRDGAGAHRQTLRLSPGLHRLEAAAGGLREVAAWSGAVEGGRCES